MTLFEAFIVFVIVWWLVFFMSLPFGIEKDNKVILGNDPGAPKNSRILLKMLITSFLSILFTFAIYFCIESGYIKI